MKLLLLNGPNLNLLGKREPGIYGDRSFEEFLHALRKHYPDHDLDHFQSNVEGELVNALQAADSLYVGVVFNAGGYTHTSVALRDCIAAIKVPVIEVHISNVLKREEFRHTSLIGGVCLGTVSGLGLDGYRLAVDHLVNHVG
ncbi:MAG: type II 3-dehydroquinate dehydratase [Flavobacteriales bacterium]|nr:type II 3-dehydroquinate dehydratase [Flavobacteriales bacterium]MBK9288804.1 type II 3-dehydroquinate dehydratase [Flavobacteriales bacterium]